MKWNEKQCVIYNQTANSSIYKLHIVINLFDSIKFVHTFIINAIHLLLSM